MSVNRIKAVRDTPRQRPKEGQKSQSVDLRTLIPEDGLREYWYPALFAKQVGKKKPYFLKILGEDVTLFRGQQGQVVALGNTCPHRGGFLAKGDCHFAGTISCPYHGWTFNETGECVAVLGEGPECRIPGMESARARVYPTKTLKGVVFIWMGEGEPAPIEEDVPEDFFDDEMFIMHTVREWNCNWRPAMENNSDAHVHYVHGNSVKFYLLSDKALISLIHLGPNRPKHTIVNDRAICFTSLVANTVLTEVKAKGESVKLPYQDAYPGLNGALWPKRGRRIHWHKAVGTIRRFKKSLPPMIKSLEWSGMHLPSTVRVDYTRWIFTRITVPIDKKHSRIFYFHATPATSLFKKAFEFARYYLWRDWFQNYNFSEQDRRVVEDQHYDTPEKLTGTDSYSIIGWRQLIVSHARGLPRVPVGEQSYGIEE
jgi:phenylpropionate dioxygenase-like ring-hydroxylating dioxygenase large terminal subunit